MIVQDIAKRCCPAFNHPNNFQKLMIKYSIALGLWALCSIAVAQEDKILTFSEAVKIALENNVDLKIQQNEQYFNQAQKNTAMARMGPSVSVFAQGWRVQGNQFIEQEARVVNDAETQNVFGSVDASIMIFNGLNRVTAIRQANATLEAQQYFVNRTRQDVITDVSNQYLKCLLDMELLIIAEQDLEARQAQLKQISAFVEAGTRAKVDEYNQIAEVKSAELLAFRAAVRLRNDRALLLQTLLIDPQTEYDLSAPSWELNLTTFKDYELEDLFSQALANRSDYLSAQKRELAADRGVWLARTDALPSLSGFGSLNSFYSDASIPSLESQFDSNLRTEYGLRLNIPIFNGLQNRQIHIRAKVDYENTKLNSERLKNQVQTEVITAYQGYEDALTNYEVTEAQLEAAQVSFDLEEERYELGNSDLILYTQANQRLTQAKGDYAQAKYTVLFQNILLQYAIGTLSFEDVR